MTSRFRWFVAAVIALSLALSGCATQPPGQAVAELATPVMPDRALQERILALDPAHLTDQDVREVLAKGPTPRIILIHGGVYPVYLLMESFGRFLVGMGYPEPRIRDPRDGSWSYSPYMTTGQLAGLVAWQYERDAMRPMLIGHSQGGLYVVKILKDLAGQSGDSLRVWNPLTWSFEDRTTIKDPLTGRQRPVVGLSVSYASAVGAGGLALVLPNQWGDLETLRRIPDTVEEFTGFFVDYDMIALSFPGNPLDTAYVADGKASVRNITLPPTYNHITVPDTADLAQDPATRAWINAYVPGIRADPSSLPLSAQLHVLWAADVWYSIKKHWCMEAQRFVRAHRARTPAESAAQ
jgi:hypothetical protein